MYETVKDEKPEKLVLIVSVEEDVGDRDCVGLVVNVAESDGERDSVNDAVKLLEKHALGL